MKNNITKLAVAAMIVVAILIAINQFGVSIDGANVVWADVIEQIRKAHSVTYKETFECDNITSIPPLITQLAMNEQGVIRTVYPGGSVYIDDWSGGIQLVIEPQQKKAWLVRFVGRPREFAIFNHFDWLISGQIEHCKFAGQETINGKETDLFVDEYNVNLRTVTIWVDPETDLPVQIKRVSFPNSDPNTKVPYINLSDSDFGGDNRRGGAAGGSLGSTTLMSDFIWNAELDESLFSTTPPDGFVVEEKQVIVSEASEKDLVDTLAFWAEMSEGLFPSAIEELTDENEIKAMLIEKFDGDEDPDQEMHLALDKAGAIVRGLRFAREQRGKGSWYYRGNGTKLGDADTAVFWYRPKGSDTYRVIYGDLHVEGSAPEDLPK